MKNYSHILFDFDGTIFNTSPGIFKSMQHVCNHYHLNYTEKDFAKMIGPSLKESFTTIFHLPENEIENAIDVYREYYSKKGMFDCELYDGVIELIKNLKSINKKILVATSKPEVYTKQILQRKNLLQYFDFVGGADIGEKVRYEKIDVINYVLKENKIESCKENCLMIGDRKYDVIGAHNAGLKCAGILWGFGNKKEFEDCNADYIFETPLQVWQSLKN